MVPMNPHNINESVLENKSVYSRWKTWYCEAHSYFRTTPAQQVINWTFIM